MSPLKYSKSDIGLSSNTNANNTLKPKPIMEKTLSYSSQQSNGSSKFDTITEDNNDAKSNTQQVHIRGK